MIEVPLESRHPDATRHPNIAAVTTRLVAPDGVYHRQPRASSNPDLNGATERSGGMPRARQRSGATPPKPCSRSRRQRSVSDDVPGESLTGGALQPIGGVLAMGVLDRRRLLEHPQPLDCPIPTVADDDRAPLDQPRDDFVFGPEQTAIAPAPAGIAPPQELTGRPPRGSAPDRAMAPPRVRPNMSPCPAIPA
jgi:hypothetical protein